MNKNKTINPMSVLKVYIGAVIINEERIELNQANSLLNPLESMKDKSKRIDEQINKIIKEIPEDEINISIHKVIFLITYKNLKAKEILNYGKDIISDEIEKYEITKFELHNELKLYCIHRKAKEEIIDNIVDLWIKIERPTLYGKQVLISSYLLRDYYGRKIIGAFPDIEYGNWNLLLEGGIKLSLDYGGRHLNTKITSSDIERWTQGELSNILNDPCYTYGIYLDNTDAFYEWQRALIYQLAILPQDISIESLENIYDDFIEFIKEEVCNFEECPTIIPKQDGLNVIKIEIENMKKCLMAKEQSLIDKNTMISLSNKYIYMPTIKSIIEKNICNIDEQCEENYELRKFKKLLKELEKDTNYEKGLAMEKVAHYFLKCIKRNQSYWKENKNKKRRNRFMLL